MVDVPALTVQNAALLALYVAIAFVPPIVYLVWVRNRERHEREPWTGLLKVFAWGAVGGVVLAVVIEALIGSRPDAVPLGLAPALYMAVIVAPFVEEFTKALGLGFAHDRTPEAEDGIVYGAAAGFGFAATENLLYQSIALASEGFTAFLATVAVRTVAATLLHGAASGLVGHGVWRRKRGEGGIGGVVGFYLLAVLLHGVYNFAASALALLGLVVALLLGFFVYRFMLQQIHRMDRRSGGRPAEV